MFSKIKDNDMDKNLYYEKRKDLVRLLKKSGYLKNEIIINAFLEIPREEFIPEHIKKRAYNDTPLEIGKGQTISAPHMIAIMCEELDIKKGQKILEIGTGSGYHASIISRIIGPKGHIYTVERHENLAEKAQRTIKKLNIKNITIKVGDGSEGLKEFQPYERIYVTCAAPDIIKPLKNQLKDPGILLLPVGKRFCELIRFTKNNKKTKVENLGGCAFVPLIGKYGH